MQELKLERSRHTEVLLSRFLDEIKHENRQLQQQLKQQPRRGNEQEQTDIPEKTVKEKKQASFMKETVKEESEFPPIPVEKEDRVETSVESKMFQMYQKGIPIEKIAKQMNRGKTEVELFIKLNQPKSN